MRKMKQSIDVLKIEFGDIINTAMMPFVDNIRYMVEGFVKLDKNTKEHLPYITVALKGTTIGTVTDATGHYFLKNLPEGNFVLEVSSVGYKTVRRNVTLKKGRTLEEDFEIEEDAVALDGVVVSANRNETTRRLAPTLVNVVDLKIFETTNSTT